MRWGLAGAALVAGCIVLAAFWLGEYGLVLRVSGGIPVNEAPDLWLWYGLPTSQAGFLVGLLLATAARGVRGVVLVLNVAVWAANGINALFWVNMFSYGVASGLLTVAGFFLVAVALFFLVRLLRPA